MRLYNLHLKLFCEKRFLVTRFCNIGTSFEFFLRCHNPANHYTFLFTNWLFMIQNIIHSTFLMFMIDNINCVNHSIKYKGGMALHIAQRQVWQFKHTIKTRYSTSIKLFCNCSIFREIDWFVIVLWTIKQLEMILFFEQIDFTFSLSMQLSNNCYMAFTIHNFVWLIYINILCKKIAQKT